MRWVRYSVINRVAMVDTRVTESTRRRFLAVAGTTVTASLGGCATFVDGFNDEQTTTGDRPVRTTTHNTTTEPTTESTSAETSTDRTTTDEQMPEPDSVTITEPTIFDDRLPLPADPSTHQYAVMGTPGTSPTATIYGNWKCPYTQEFVRTTLPNLVEDYVQTGDVAIEFRSVAYRDDDPFLGPDAPRATRAGLAAWRIDPQTYWQYFAYVFGNQPAESVAWAQPDILTRFAARADVDPVTRFERRFERGTDSDLVQATARDFARLDAAGVPRVVTADAVTAPTVNEDATRDQFRRLLFDG